MKWLHIRAGFPAVFGARLIIEIGNLLQTAIADGGGDRDQPADEAGGQLDRRLGE
jgi:hypothetical protein